MVRRLVGGGGDDHRAERKRDGLKIKDHVLNSTALRYISRGGDDLCVFSTLHGATFLYFYFLEYIVQYVFHLETNILQFQSKLLF